MGRKKLSKTQRVINAFERGDVVTWKQLRTTFDLTSPQAMVDKLRSQGYIPSDFICMILGFVILEVYLKRIKRIYAEHAPDKHVEVSRLLKMNKGKEHVLYAHEFCLE